MCCMKGPPLDGSFVCSIVQHSHSTCNKHLIHIPFSNFMHAWEIPRYTCYGDSLCWHLRFCAFTSSALSTCGGGALACLGFSSAVALPCLGFSSAIALLSLGFCSRGLTVACTHRGHFSQLRVAEVVLCMAAGTSSNWQRKFDSAWRNLQRLHG